jgi:hypothetical protein
LYCEIREDAVRQGTEMKRVLAMWLCGNWEPGERTASAKALRQHGRNSKDQKVKGLAQMV